MTDDIMRKIRGLLAKAESSEFPGETEAFTQKAEALMQKYAIDHALLAASGKTVRETPTFRVFPFEDQYSKPKSFILAAITKSFGGITVRHLKGQVDPGLHVFAFPSDLALIEVLYTSLLLQATNDLNHTRVVGHAKSFRSSFWYSFAVRTHERLQEERSSAVKNTPGAGLVLVNREDEVLRHQSEVTPNTKQIVAGRSTSREGRAAGRSAADRADIGHTRVGGTHLALH